MGKTFARRFLKTAGLLAWIGGGGLAGAADFDGAPTVAATSSGVAGVELCGAGRVSRADFKAAVLGGPERPGERVVAALADLARRGHAAHVALATRMAAGPAREQVAARVLMNDGVGAVVLAQRSRDPVVYRLALPWCPLQLGLPSSSNCGSLSLEQWAQLDPTAARPWLRFVEALAPPPGAAATTGLRGPQIPSSSAVLLATIAPAIAQIGDRTGLGLALLARVRGDAWAWAWRLEFSSAIGLCRSSIERDFGAMRRCRLAARQLLSDALGVTDPSPARAPEVRLLPPSLPPPFLWPYDVAEVEAVSRQLQASSFDDLGEGLSCSRLEALGNRLLAQAQQAAR